MYILNVEFFVPFLFMFALHVSFISTQLLLHSKAPNKITSMLSILKISKFNFQINRPSAQCSRFTLKIVTIEHFLMFDIDHFTYIKPGIITGSAMLTCFSVLQTFL